jgi:hypothetical protein
MDISNNKKYPKIHKIWKGKEEEDRGGKTRGGLWDICEEDDGRQGFSIADPDPFGSYHSAGS